MGQPIVGSNPTLSASPPRPLVSMPEFEIVALPMAEFTFAPGEPYAGQSGVVVAYAVRHPDGVFLFDTGFGSSDTLTDPAAAEFYERHRVVPRALPDVLAAAGIDTREIYAVANCHLHLDHSGQNWRFPGLPIYVQPAEWQAAHQPDYTILDWIDFPGARYEARAGDHAILPGIRLLATPGHSPGHQSLAVDTAEGLVVLAGQAVYSHGEWIGTEAAREGRSSAPDTLSYDRSVERLRALHPRRVLFGHDRRGWPD
jgi:N-acyl homoserine lactone hydrolase